MARRQPTEHIPTTKLNAELLSAAKRGETEAVRRWLAAGADVKAATRWGETALMGAAWGGHTHTVACLLAAGADMEAATGNGSTVLMGAAQKGHTHTVACLLEGGADVEGRMYEGDTALGTPALVWAAQKRLTDMVQLLHQARPNSRKLLAIRGEWRPNKHARLPGGWRAAMRTLVLLAKARRLPITSSLSGQKDPEVTNTVNDETPGKPPKKTWI